MITHGLQHTEMAVVLGWAWLAWAVPAAVSALGIGLQAAFRPKAPEYQKTVQDEINERVSNIMRGASVRRGENQERARILAKNAVSVLSPQAAKPIADARVNVRAMLDEGGK